MAGVVCLAILETGERKKFVLPTAAYAELLAALAPFVPVNENTLLQIHDDDLDDFIDLEADVIISSKEKIKVARKTAPHTDDNNDLIVYGETLESRQKHIEWLQDNFFIADAEDFRPRLLATTKERHECLRQITLPEALLQYPFLATEHSLLMEFNILFKRTIVDNIEHGGSRLCSIIVDHGEQDEVVRFSAMATEDGVLGVLNFIAGRCNESLDAILTEEESLASS
ncbi:hypothetical protein HPB49_005680 [Dermacentor silvarum]|uniref:Uncharacterized protein n=1 Tax=Dermacentor silvarum TaxID=543639 RepID=A0ACB8C7I4_DERSI|nr:hypothetical protein HPB49_005680 [Dermacentor silvarum]